MSGKRKKPTADSLPDWAQEPEALPDWAQEPAPNIREDWGDAANGGASVQQPPVGPEIVADEAYGPQENPVQDPGRMSALGHAVLNGFLKQGSDEAYGTLGRLRQPIAPGAMFRMPDGTMRPADDADDRYRAVRDAERQTLAAGREYHPGLSFAGQVIGDVGSDALLRYLGVPVEAAPYQMASGATSLVLGDDTADLVHPTPEAMMATGERAALGAALGYVAPKVGAAAGRMIGKAARGVGGYLSDAWEGSALQDWLQQSARERALKAAGYIQKDFPKDSPARLERLYENGQRLLDEPGLIGPLSSKEAIANRLEPLVEREGERIGAHLDAADAASTGAPWVGATADDVAVPAATGQTPGFNPYAFAADARQSVETPFVQNPSLRMEGLGVRQWLDDLTDTANTLEAEGQPFTFRRANAYKGDLQSKVFNPSGLPKANKAAQDELQRTFTQAIDEQAAPHLGPEALADFQDARRTFGAFKDALSKAQQGANREAGNNMLGLKDWDAAQVAAQSGAGWLSPLVAVGSKLVRGRADSLAARSLNGVAAGTSDWLESLESANPGALGRYITVLGAAAARSPEAVGQVHNQLSETDPEYQQRMRALGGQGQ